MKTWNEAELVSIDLNETQCGGNKSSHFDNAWHDENNALHVTFLIGAGENS